MPALLASIFWGVFMLILRSVVLRVLVSLGISAVTFVGVNQSMKWIIDRGLQSLNGLPADLVSLIAFLKVGVCISMLMSAITMRMLLKFGSSDKIKKMVMG